jgi:hypothetical protein
MFASNERQMVERSLLQRLCPESDGTRESAAQYRVWRRPAAMPLAVVRQQSSAVGRWRRIQQRIRSDGRPYCLVALLAQADPTSRTGGRAYSVRAPFPKPSPEPLREGKPVHAPVATQSAQKTSPSRFVAGRVLWSCQGLTHPAPWPQRDICHGMITAIYDPAPYEAFFWGLSRRRKHQMRAEAYRSSRVFQPGQRTGT